jgi:hypothetical protein
MKTSELFVGGGAAGLPYASGVPAAIMIPNSLSQYLNMPADNDAIHHFTPRADVTVDKIWWVRRTTGAADVYVGVYDASGTLLSDCAVDSDTTEGLHEVDTTNFDMTAGRIYYWCINQSAQVAIGDVINSSDPDYFRQYSSVISHDFRNRATGGSVNLIDAKTSSRTNAALLSSITPSSFSSTSNVAMLGGFTPA